MLEGEPHSELVRPGQLYFLAHPGSELFSGYGLTTHHGRKDRLVGLLIHIGWPKLNVVSGVKGVVVAGRKNVEDPHHVREYFDHPPLNTTIDLLTYDDLVKGLLSISRQLA